MAYEAASYLRADTIRQLWLTPVVHFSYYGFEWLPRWPLWGMYTHFAALTLFAFLLATGAWYRLAASCACVLFSYQFLLEQSLYLNHYYAVILLLLLFAVLPRASGSSIQANMRSVQCTVPLWAVWLLRFQVGVIYVYGGIAKLGSGWLDGYFVRAMTARHVDMPFVSFLVSHDWHVGFFAYGGVLFDLLVVPGLLWRRTRSLAYCFVLAFNFINAQLLDIGIFPWLMIAATTIFFRPEWPRVVVDSLFRDGSAPVVRLTRGRMRIRRVGALLLVCYVFLQIAVPLRHHLYGGDVAWTEEGHRFSWRMMLRKKEGVARFQVMSNGRAQWIDPADYLTPWQLRDLVGRPDMILQFAHYLAWRERQAGNYDAIVMARVTVSLNGAPSARLVDETVNLASIRRNLLRANWITAAPIEVDE